MEFPKLGYFVKGEVAEVDDSGDDSAGSGINSRRTVAVQNSGELSSSYSTNNENFVRPADARCAYQLASFFHIRTIFLEASSWLKQLPDQLDY